ncbi:cilia- and flagella-associated protein 46-like, partial [Diadema antillarum]|uniref:cilia- and flagella-associated protein 46-like n=1 Tax=Diadema antillarum TaxID=105358 RepID=UPI003A8C8395
MATKQQQKRSISKQGARTHCPALENIKVRSREIPSSPCAASTPHLEVARMTPVATPGIIPPPAERGTGDAFARSPTAPLLMDLARLCAEHNLPDLLARTLDAMKNFPLKDKGTFFEMEFLQCELMVRNLLDKQEVYSKNTVEVRLHAIDRQSEAVMNAVRHGDPNVIQAGCVTLWNLCLPLLQTNLRSQVRKPLTLVAESLENIDSLLILLRCQLHTELAKCEEDVEQIQVAMEHLRKALSLDDGGQYRERLETALHRLDLRAELYKLPERLEDQAAMIIEQARTSSDSGTVLMKRSLLVKAGQALSPDAFMLVLESEREPK